MGPAAVEKFCLRWNDFESNITGAFKELREDKDFFDVILACADGQIQAHKLILSACSTFFCTILRRNKHEHPLLYLKGVKYTYLVSVLNFMYYGEVNVAQEELSSFLAAAEELKVKGLTQNGAGSESMTMNVEKETGKTLAQADELLNLPPQNHSCFSPPTVPMLTPNMYEAAEEDDKQEFMTVKPEAMASEYTVAGLESDITADPTEINEEYEVFEDDGIDGEDAMRRVEYTHQQGQAGSSGVFESLLHHAMTEGQDALTTTAAKISKEDSAGADVDILLEQHISRQLGPDRTDYVCLLCSKSCKSRDECANHIEVHHLKIVRSCPYCAIELTSRGGLRQHISRKHREEHKLSKGNPNF